MDQQDVIEIIGKAIYAISITSIVIAVGLVWYKITGHSPTADQLIITLQSGTLAGIFAFIYYFAEFKGSIRSDVKRLQQDSGRLQQSLLETQKEIIKIQAKISGVQGDVTEIKGILSKKRGF